MQFEQQIFFTAPGTAPQTDFLAPVDEGELAVDIFETNEAVIVQSTIAGARLEDLELSLHNDMLTIRGRRHHDVPLHAKLIYAECYWGAFSRSIILPAEVRADEATAILRTGVLTITLPKRNRLTIPVQELE